MHKLFELILKKHPNLEMTEEQLHQLIDNVRPKPEEFIHKKQWLLMKEYLNRLLKEFLIKEKQQRENFPHLKPVAFEAKLKAFWNQKTGELSHQGEYVFKGYLDRVDQDEETKQYVLRDYKASSRLLSHVSSWLKTEELQLTFYAQALEKGLIENLPVGKVSALFYSAYNDQFTTKGFVEKDSGLSGVMEKTRGHKKEKKILYEVINSSNLYTQKMVAKMEKGTFVPNPINTKICLKCFYRAWCRVEEINA